MDMMLDANVAAMRSNPTFNDGNVDLKIALDLAGSSHPGDLHGG
jgi:hypothetical protein